MIALYDTEESQFMRYSGPGGRIMYFDSVTDPAYLFYADQVGYRYSAHECFYGQYGGI